MRGRRPRDFGISRKQEKKWSARNWIQFQDHHGCPVPHNPLKVFLCLSLTSSSCFSYVATGRRPSSSSIALWSVHERGLCCSLVNLSI
ncbi:hypothetical protein GE21DRAFT_1038971 [Neurospora crassa]|nr:hypothetical protein GE21DRAFT_1038971 [Neurospora crassa]